MIPGKDWIPLLIMRMKRRSCWSRPLPSLWERRMTRRRKTTVQEMQKRWRRGGADAKGGHCPLLRFFCLRNFWFGKTPSAPLDGKNPRRTPQPPLAKKSKKIWEFSAKSPKNQQRKVWSWLDPSNQPCLKKISCMNEFFFSDAEQHVSNKYRLWNIG